MIHVPEALSNIEFGGPERTTPYITAGNGSYRIETNLTSYHIWLPRK